MKHTDREYEEQLRELRDSLLRMAGRVEEMIGNAVRALVERDVALAKRTIEQDHEVNRAERETDELCMLILAKRQPMASDLRTIMLAFKMVTDIERMGDLAVNICERAQDLSTLPELPRWDKIEHMALLTRGMVRDAIDAFVDHNSARAQQVIDRDDDVDELYTQCFRDLLAEMVRDPSTIERGIHVQSVAKWLERIADHSTNLAELVIFMVHAKDVRHLGKLPGDPVRT